MTKDKKQGKEYDVQKLKSIPKAKRKYKKKQVKTEEILEALQQENDIFSYEPSMLQCSQTEVITKKEKQEPSQQSINSDLDELIPINRPEPSVVKDFLVEIQQRARFEFENSEMMYKQKQAQEVKQDKLSALLILPLPEPISIRIQKREDQFGLRENIPQFVDFKEDQITKIKRIFSIKDPYTEIDTDSDQENVIDLEIDQDNQIQIDSQSCYESENQSAEESDGASKLPELKDWWYGKKSFSTPRRWWIVKRYYRYIQLKQIREENPSFKKLLYHTVCRKDGGKPPHAQKTIYA